MAATEDLQFSNILPLLLYAILACTLWAYLLQLWWNRKWEIPETEGRLPPGSMGYVGVGESLQLLKSLSSFFDKKDATLGPIYKTHIIGNPTIRFSGSEYVKHIYNGDSDLIETLYAKTVCELLGTSSLISLKGKEHKEARLHIMTAFKKNYLQNYIPRIYTIIERTLNEWCDMDTVLVYKRMQEMAFEAAWEVIIGLPLTRKELKYLTDEFNTLVSGMFTVPFNIPGFPYYKALKAKQVLRGFIEKAIGRGDDLSHHTVLGMMLHMKRDTAEEFSKKQILDETTELLFAGHDTVSSVATSMVICLSRHKIVRKKLLKEIEDNDLMDPDSAITFDCISKMDYLNNFIKEVLRLYPPAGGSFRKAKRTFQLGGYTIPKGWALIASIKNTHQQANIPEVAQFKPERWDTLTQSATDYSYIPFGAGPRICVGREYAKVYLRVFTICLLRMCDVQILSEKVEMIENPFTQPKDNLPSRFTHRSVEGGDELWNDSI